MKTVRIGTHNIYIKDIIIALIIAALPFLFFLYKLAPETQVWDLGMIKIDAGSFDAVNYFLWNVCVKLFVLFILIIWFVTSKHWWRNIILVPVIIELFKFFSIVNGRFSRMDEVEYIQSLPFTIPIILGLFFLSKKLNYYSSNLMLSDDLNSEIESVFNKITNQSKINSVKSELHEIKRNKKLYSEQQYLEMLLVLRDKIYKL